MDSIAQIDVPVAARTKHDLIAWGFSAKGMGGPVLEAGIGFYFANRETKRLLLQPSTKYLSEEIPCHLFGGSLEKGWP